MAQVWLVTGSSRGLGRAIVEAGLAAGNKVLETARDIKSLADLPDRYGDQVKLFAMDVTDEAAAANAVMAAVDVFGSLDVVINNAGGWNRHCIADWNGWYDVGGMGTLATETRGGCTARCKVSVQITFCNRARFENALCRRGQRRPDFTAVRSAGVCLERAEGTSW